MRFTKKTPTFLFSGLLLIFMGIVFSCQGENKEIDSISEEKKDSFSQKLEFKNSMNINLLPEAKETTSEWLAFITAQAQLKKFKNFTVQDAVSYAATIKQIMEALQETIPENLQKKPVYARINVLLTLSSVLHQKVSNPTITAEEIRVTAEKIPPAFNHLKIQINELFRKGLEEYKLELNQKADSLQNKELKRNTPRRGVLQLENDRRN